ncbi:glucokinase [Leucobacter komagatae]|uniref:Glucokinase n=1 Tax=Leucobacter komagatae TaxID=55969 RepID=A0A542Y7G9_9MICO|nr:ROK family protein [Leucobacter komagatae]TQL44053.1 glucokinase [Leucobacter komagatae]
MTHTADTHTGVFAGIDIGGTKIAVVLVDAAGDILARGSAVAPAKEGGEAMATTAARLTADLLGESGGTLGAAGVGAAGVFDYDTGVVTAASSTFVDWVGFPLRTRLEELLGVPIAIENDVNAFLLGEVAFDAHAEPDAFGVMLGTGVGGALILDGTLRRGARGGAGEIGHTPGYSDLVCTCKQTGHLETLASGTSIGLRYAERTGASGLTAKEIADRARAGDADARAVFANAGRALALACASMSTLLDVAEVIVGGGVSHAWDLLSPAMDETLRTAAPITGTPLRIQRAKRGGDAVALGAAASAQKLLRATLAQAQSNTQTREGAAR